jgi:hypothetical protein
VDLSHHRVRWAGVYVPRADTTLSGIGPRETVREVAYEFGGEDDASEACGDDETYEVINQR